MKSLSRYSKYRDSGIEWIGEIPEHWEIKKVKWFFKQEKRRIKSNDKIITCFRDGEVTLRSNRKTEGFTNALKEHGYQGIRKNDLVIHNMDAFAGAVGVSDSDGKATPVYSVCTPYNLNEIKPYFYAFYLRNLARKGFIQSLSKGIRERSTDFRFNDFKELTLPIPPIEEQKTIIDYIQESNSKIGKAITQKQELIKLLKERQQIVINSAVTKGIDSSVVMKDSGVEWLGGVPEHWETTKLGLLLTPINIKNMPKLPLLSVVREQGIILRDIENQDTNHNFIPDDLSNYKVVKKGQFVMNKMKAWQGSYGVSNYTGIVSPAYYVFKLKNAKLIPNFFHIAIRAKFSYVPFFIQASDGVRIGQLDLSKSRMKEIPFFIPPIEEQNAIIKYIQESSSKIDKAINLKKREIERLKELKETLIDGCVTGRVRV